MKPDFFRLGSWLGRPSIPSSLIPEAALALDRRQTDFFLRTIRQLIRHGAWEEAWALIELSTEVHRYNPAFHRACERARHRLIRLLFSAPPSIATAPECHPPPIPDLRQPFVQLSQRCEDALLQINPQGITHWGCVIFPGISRGRFQGPRQKRFCNAVVDERYMLCGLPLEDDPQVRILKKRFQQGLSWEESGGRALHSEYCRRTGGRHTSWTSFQNHQLNGWDRLFARIQQQGYLSQAELQKQRGRAGRFGLFNEVEVCVNAKGKVLFLEGKHRLAMAQILGLPSIPVIVNCLERGFSQEASRPVRACSGPAKS